MSKLQRTGNICAGLSFTLGLIGLAGWIFNKPVLRSLWPSGSEMKFNTALSLALLGGSILLSSRKSRARHFGVIGAALVFLVGLLTNLEYVLSLNLGIDQLVFIDPSAVGTTHPGRMTWYSATNFMALALATLLRNYDTQNNRRPSQWLALASLLFPSQALLGYFYGRMTIIGLGPQSSYMAVPTAVAFLGAGMALLLYGAGRDLMATLTAPTRASAIFRRLLLASVLVPLVLGWTTLDLLGGRHYAPEYSVATVALLTTFLFVVLTWFNAARVNASERVLQQREQLYSHLVENIHDVVFRLDAGLRHLYISPSVERLSGIPAHTFLGKTGRDVGLPSEACDRFEAMCQAAAQTERQQEMEFQHHDRIMLTRVIPEVANGHGLTLLGLTTDITERKTREKQLVEQARLLDLSANAIIVRDPEDRIVYWNKGAEEIYGYTRAEAMGQVTHQVLRTEHPATLPHILELLHRHDRWEGELVHTRRDGTPITVWSRWSLDHDASGNPASILETNIDISERKRAEEAIRRQAALIEAINDSTSELIFMKDLEGRLTYANAATLRVVGRSTEGAVGTSDRKLFRDASEYEPIAENDRTVARTGETITAEEPYTGADGKPRVYLSTKSPLRDERGDIVGVIGVSRDITGQKQLEAEREETLERERALRATAEIANRVKDEFLATVSHELRTPLNAMLGWATMLRSRKMDEITTRRGIEAIERNAKSQAQLIEDLLDVSRIISGKMRLDMKPVVLTDIIRAAIESVRPAAEAKQIDLQMTIEVAADNIRADQTRLQQVIWNLLSNSVKFTPRAGSVAIDTKRSDSMAQIIVTDTGEGIRKEFLPYVFDRFQQGDASITRQHGGLGLGLAIARHLVEMHGGTIQVDSEGAGRGATFTVSLPILAITPLPAETPVLSELTDVSVGAQIPGLTGVKILAIDDVRDTRELLRALLEQCGADVIIASSAREGLDALTGWRPDVIVCDIGMPEEDGYSFISKVRQLPATEGGNVPAIALTGYVRVEDRMRALEAGYQMFVPKPVEAQELASIILMALAERTNRL